MKTRDFGDGGLCPPAACWKIQAPAVSLEEEQTDEQTLRSTEALSLSIDQAAAWILGGRDLKGLLGGMEPPYWCAYVKGPGPVFLDEVV